LLERGYGSFFVGFCDWRYVIGGIAWVFGCEVVCHFYVFFGLGGIGGIGWKFSHQWRRSRGSNNETKEDSETSKGSHREKKPENHSCFFTF